MSKLWLIRHAESEANIGSRTSDPAQIQISKRGLAQAEEIASKFIEVPSLIITSSYIRTKQTAAATMRRFKNVPHEEWNVHEFTYLSPRKCQSTTSHDRLPMVQKYWTESDPLYCDGPGAESFVDLIGRVQSTIKLLKARNEKFIILFSHGQFLSALLWIMDTGTEISSERMRQYKEFVATRQIMNAEIIEMLLNPKGIHLNIDLTP